MTEIFKCQYVVVVESLEKMNNEDFFSITSSSCEFGCHGQTSTTFLGFFNQCWKPVFELMEQLAPVALMQFDHVKWN